MEGPLGADQEGAELPLLDDHPLGAALEDPLPGAVHVPVARELARLGVIHHQEVDLAEELEEDILLALDPVVHRVADHELRRLDLAQDAELELRIDVAEEEIVGGTEAFGELRLEVGEDAEA